MAPSYFETVTAVELKKRSEIHWARKLWHMSGVTGLALLYNFLPLEWSKALITTAVLTLVPMDIFRPRFQKLNDLLLFLFRPLLREYEETSVTGASYMIIGLAYVIWIFPREIVLLTMLFLAFADPIASYVGIRFGKDKIIGQKSLQGSFAALITCAIITLGFLHYNGILLDRILMVSILGGLIGALSELVPVWKLDDNFSLPVLSSTILFFVFTLLGAFS